MFVARVRNEPVKVTIDGNVINQPDLCECGSVQESSCMKKVRHQISPMVAEMIFKSMILPLFFYCYHIFGGISNAWLRKFELLMQKANSIIKMQKKRMSTFNTRLRRKIAIDVFKSLKTLLLENTTLLLLLLFILITQARICFRMNWQ